MEKVRCFCGSHSDRLIEAGGAVMEGDYRRASSVVTALHVDQTVSGTLREMAELFGLMSVKVEARELCLERALDDVRRRNDQLEREMQLRMEFTRLFTGSVILLCLYAATVSFLETVMHLPMRARDISTQLLNCFLYSVLGGMILFFVRRHRYPLSTFGLTTRNWRRSLLEGLLCALAFLPALVVVKASLVRYNPAWAGQPLIEWTNWGPWQMIFVYMAVAFLQELAGRGFTQSCLERLLKGERPVGTAILLASAQFGVMHLHYSFQVGLIAFLGSVVFGALYARHRTVIGVTVCHFVLGQMIFGPLQLAR